MKSKIASIALAVFLFFSLTIALGATLGTQIYALESRVSELQSDNRALQQQIAELKSEFALAGQTPSETAQKIVKRYHETHIYSEYDFFVCADMALDVWDMLKAQGIPALIQVGNVESEAKTIADANHAWVLAEISPSEHLALETTGGYAVWSNENERYYKGWAFDNPREYKRFVELMHEINSMKDIATYIDNTYTVSYEASQRAANEMMQLGNQLGGMSIYDPALSSQIGVLITKAEECGEYIGKCKQLNELSSEYKEKIDKIILEMISLVS